MKVRWIANLILGGVLWGLGRSPVCAQAGTLHPSSPEVRRAVVVTIRQQLEAFRAGQLDRAYGLASEALRAQVPEGQFMAIVRDNYPDIWHNQKATFGIVTDNGKAAAVTVRVYASDESTRYDYSLAREGSFWRISGVLKHVAQPEDAL